MKTRDFHHNHLIANFFVQSARAITLAVLICLPLTAMTGELDNTQQSAIEEITKQFMEAGAYPSAVVLIDQGGETIYARALGMADLENDMPANMETAYAIGSITKSFTGLAINLLAYRGKIDLAAPLNKYLPDYDGPAASVKVRRLLDHTNGIPNYTGQIPGVRKKLPRNEWSREEMVGFFEQQALLFEPGAKFSYTNSGYYLLGLIIEKVSGMSYYEFLQKNVFDPLEMTRTYSGDDSELISNRARGYAAGKLGFVNAPPWSYLIPYSAGSLVSTAGDLVKYRRGVFHSDYFPPKLREMLLTTSTLNGGEPNIYAQSGLIESDFEGHRKISHGGDIWGYSANHAFYPDEDITIIILTNNQADAPVPSSMEQKIARVVFGIPQPEIKDLAVNEKDLTRYAGNYYLHPYLFGMKRMGFIGQEGKLYIRFGGTDVEGPMVPLLAQGDGIFRAIFDDEWVFQFILDEDGEKAGNLKSWYRDGTFLAKRED
jgi:CubicO group peptidase (beta-lactamase class C family)